MALSPFLFKGVPQGCFPAFSLLFILAYRPLPRNPPGLHPPGDGSSLFASACPFRPPIFPRDRPLDNVAYPRYNVADN